MTSIKIKEIFGPTLQGEGRMTGVPAIFVRTVGCNMWSGLEKDRANSPCSFCDTDFVSGERMSPAEIVNKVMSIAKGVKLVVITGGEPTLQPENSMLCLVQMLHEQGMMVQVETNGTRDAEWLDHVYDVTVSPKVSFERCAIKWKRVTTIKVLHPHVNDPSIKPEDFVMPGKALYIQAIWGDTELMTKAVNKVIELAPSAQLSIQTHKIIGVQ